MIADPALVLVDLQNDFAKRTNADEGAFEADPRYQPAVNAAAAFVERYRASGRTPIFVGGQHHDHTVSAEWARRYDRPSGMSVVAGTEGEAFVPELGVREDEPVVRKNRYDGFFQTNLDLHLRTNDISRVLFGGISTNVCVASTIHGAYNRDYAVTLLADCAASKDPDQHRATLDLVEGHFGRVERSTDVELDPVGEAAD